MNSLYLSFRQSRLLRVLALAIFGIVASSAAAETIDLGELELDKSYNIPSDLNSYIGHVTAPKNRCALLCEPICELQRIQRCKSQRIIVDHR